MNFIKEYVVKILLPMNNWGISANRLTSQASGAVVGVKLELLGLGMGNTRHSSEGKHGDRKYHVLI